MKRRTLLWFLGVAAAGGVLWRYRDWLPTRGLLNPCLPPGLPEDIAAHPAVAGAFEGLDLSIQGPLRSNPPGLTLSKSSTLWDGIVGAEGRIELSDSWYMPYYFDVGAGDSSLTWQAMAGFGRAFNWGDLTLTYRHLSYDQSGDKLVQDLSLGGPELGVIFRF